MNKNSSNKSITRRMIALLTIAVFVFVMGFCPVSTVTAADTDQPAGIESTEAVNGDEVLNDEEMIEENVDEVDIEATETTNAQEAKEPNHKGSGHNDVKEIQKRISNEVDGKPAVVKKNARKSSKLDSEYDPRQQAWFKNHVDVLDQGYTETCWAHAASTVAQISYLYELNKNGQSITKDYDFSPFGFAYNFYNRQAYPTYGYTAKDKNNPGKYSDFEDNGGNIYLSSQALANWMGMYSRSSGNYPPTYNDDLILENAVFVPDDYYSSVGLYNLNIDATKEAINKYGAVVASIWFDDESYLATDGKSYYCDYDWGGWGNTNHEVSIVGWDDNYDRDNFDSADYLPAIDGAWIVQNSYGKNIYDGGYFYVSYYDWSFCNAVALDMQPVNTYNCNYHYDGNACANYKSYKLKSDCANVFTVANDDKRHTVKAVGLTTWNDTKTDYNIKIYRKVKSTPTTGKLAASFDVTTENPGCYTFDLGKKGVEPVKLNTGEKFAVVVRATATGKADKKKMWIGYEKKGSYKWISFSSKGKSKTSYYKLAGKKKWKNLYKSDKSASFRIKAFTTTENRISLSGATITLPQYNYDYTKKAIKPEPTVKLSGKTLVRDEDYTVSYAKNKNLGTATVTVKGIGLYKDTASKQFTIGKVTGIGAKDVTATSLTLYWDKQAKVGGYKVYRVTDKGDKLIKTIKKASTVTFTDKKLTPNTNYTYKVKAFKKIKKKTYTGPASDTFTTNTASE